jgi:hypothetical protein
LYFYKFLFKLPIGSEPNSAINGFFYSKSLELLTG